tara:strand:- start:6488 stop:7084 length:597 start_codon:yes stop_codon:yes gene_type:complete
MKKQVIFSCAAVVSAVAGQASATVYTDSASFMGALSASYTNGFDGAVPGPSADLNFSDGTFSYTVGASGAGGSGLYNDTGLISTDNALDGILVTFTSGNVTAVGGNMWATDISVFPVNAQVTVSLSDGTVESFASSSAADYRGFTSGVVITSIFIDADDSLANAWSTLDNLTVGTTIPAPASVAMLGLGGLVATRRRR